MKTKFVLRLSGLLVGIVLVLFLSIEMGSRHVFTPRQDHSSIQSPLPSASLDHVPVSTPIPTLEIAAAASPTTPEPVPVETPLVLFNGQIEHIFFHPLIAFPELAFDGDSMAKGYNDWFVTVKEFNKILDSLYRNQYILIDIGSLYTEKEGVVRPQELWLPANKKPLVLSIDDLNYYTYMRENGNASRLVLDDNGEVATYSMTPQGEPITARNSEIVPILDDFVHAHPDFSWHGAKGVIALTGYEGILGYRTDQRDSPNYINAKEGVLPVIKRLKETGWTFASHGYGHLDTAKITLNRFKQDTLRWKQEVEPLIGATSVYIYPFGSSVLPEDRKYQFLMEEGFRIMCSVGPVPYLAFKPDSVMMDRRHIDGIALHDQRSRLLPLFDSQEIWDSIRPGSGPK
ncbi:hypothetical protein M5X11_20595 [Paenibacillus alginolyticus]|uniref:hypothetical protein n=1 Tax=Paenibacillus alginolyticus TaxID=59839 RepID=UPI00040866E7|nr:hypothetical protein [Paenibacillus alginolyticus]MCY9667292.1 hypothetical protein [Paenibacillus alginolyticus]